MSLDEHKLAFEEHKHFRDRWWLEEGIANQRLNWLLTSQGFLGATYAYLVSQTQANKISTVLLTSLPWLAAFLGLVVLIGIFAAFESQEKLRGKAPAGTFSEERHLQLFGRLVPLLMAAVITFAWVVLGMSQMT